MEFLPVCCPHCGSDQVIKRGTTAAGKQRYRCQSDTCGRRTFLHDYSYRACRPEVRQRMIDMVASGQGIRHTGRVLGIGKDTVARALKLRQRIAPLPKKRAEKC